MRRGSYTPFVAWDSFSDSSRFLAPFLPPKLNLFARTPLNLTHKFSFGSDNKSMMKMSVLPESRCPPPAGP